MKPARRLASIFFVPAITAWIASLIATAAMAATLEFRAPASADDAAVPLRDLADRLLPVYQDANPDRYLANLSALQMAAGHFEAADQSRQSLRARRHGPRSAARSTRDVVFDIYAHAKALQTTGRASFADALTTSYRDVASRLDDRSAFQLNTALHSPAARYEEALQRLLDRQHSSDSIGEPAALELVWSYLYFDAYRSFAPAVDAITDEDDGRRYQQSEDIVIDGRDGARIAVVSIRPRSAAKPLPALFEYTLYDSAHDAKECAAQGYVGVVAYGPGVHGTRGPVIPYQDDGDRARAVIGWIVKQPWSDGRVAMLGEAYSGFAAWAAAKYPPAALKAIATSAPSAPGVDVPMAGNIYQNSSYRWSLYVSDKDPADEKDYYDDSSWHALNEKWYASGAPYRDLGRIRGKPSALFIRWLNHPSYDRYWQNMLPYQEQFAKIDIPVLTMSGYFAGSEPGALWYFNQHRRYNPRADHTLLIGPYDDALMQRGPLPVLQAYSVDSAALIDARAIRYQWLDHVLKGGGAPPLLAGRVNYEVMGANDWRHAASIDSMARSAVRYYLDPADAARDTHHLSQRRNTHDSAVDQSIGLENREDAAWNPSLDLISKSLAPRYQVLYESDPLPKPLELSGLFSTRLDFAVNKMDVDLNLVLYEHLANGDYFRLFSPTDEQRASYAGDRAHRHLLKAGERQVVSFRSERLTSRLMQPGSRLVLILGIGKRPDREINYGTGDDVGAESVEQGKVPIKIRWFSDSYIDVPVTRMR